MSNKRYRNAEWLQEQYIEKDRTQKEIADKCGVSDSTISRWCDKLDIEKVDIATFDAHKRGYERWLCQAGGTYDEVTVHRLLATLKIDELSELDGMHVHHESGVPWDNRLENLHVLTPSEHRHRHV